MRLGDLVLQAVVFIHELCLGFLGSFENRLRVQILLCTLLGASERLGERAFKLADLSGRGLRIGLRRLC